MSKYETVRIGDTCKELAKKAKELKAANKFNAELFDAVLVADITKLQRQAADYIEKNRKLVETKHADAKKSMGIIDVQYKKNPFTDVESGKIAEEAKTVKALLKEIQDDTKELDAALDPQYRRPWLGEVKELLGNKDKLRPFEDQRRVQAGVADTVASLAKRIEEYTKRSDNYAKNTGTKSDKLASYRDIAEDLKNVDKDVEKQAKDIEGMANKSKAAIGKLDTLAKKKAWDANDVKAAKEWLSTVVATAKDMRGAFKTMDEGFDLLLERSLDAPSSAEQHKSKMKKAEQLTKTTKRQVEDYGKKEDSLVALVKKFERALR